MRLLLDTHTFLSHADDDPRMTAQATALLIDPANDLFFSIAPAWEIAIKVGLKKLGDQCNPKIGLIPFNLFQCN